MVGTEQGVGGEFEEEGGIDGEVVGYSDCVGVGVGGCFFWTVFFSNTLFATVFFFSLFGFFMVYAGGGKEERGGFFC